ncbi:lysosomal alpha-mannosidase-like isoform X4 [Scylla paramamosain]|uniref:lysosomal alpha-mannosidase-like isoform X4 n=1 Tax=Scylla paramamosain TaxID=85552 RepID=UPI00308373A3
MTQPQESWLLGVVLLLATATTTHQANPSCHPVKEGMLNVHLVCHTHDDVGWLKTVDQYFYGAHNSIQRAGVQYILDSVVDALLKNPDRKFIYVESAFFFRWWNEQTPERKDVVKSLVRSGQLEFIGGGWCMNDEATAHYNAIIDQMTLGLVKLNETFGEAARPTVAWQIDPFGHSREQASIFAQMGFDGLFFGRLDHDDKNHRWDTHTMEMMWQGSQNLGDAAWLFTGVLPRGYSPPVGFCFDILCSDEPIMDDPRLHDYNVDKKVESFLKIAKAQSDGYATSHIIMTMGMDFQYQNANTWFVNLDKLIRYVNKRQSSGSQVNVLYSTPSCYLSALHDANQTWTSKTDDFFPYASGNHSYWTGYFTSRPTLKGYVRQTNGILQAVKQVASLLGMGHSEGLETLKEAMGVLQHHDAVSGTEKQHVADDYSERLAIGTKAALGVMGQALSKLQPVEALQKEKEKDGGTFHFCPLLNISSCPITESSSAFIMTVYNPIARPISHYVRLPVPSDTAYKVTDYKGNAVKAQLVPIPKPVLSIPGRHSTAAYELVFQATDIPPLGFLRYHIKRTSSYRILRQQISKTHSHVLGGDDPIELSGDENLAISVDPKTGLLERVGAVRPGPIQMIPVSQNFLVYPGMAGNNTKEQYRASGAYIFRPNATEAREIAKKVNVVTVEGPLVYEVHQEWGPWVSQVIRSYMGHLNLEMEWLVGPIPIRDKIGLEVVSRVDWSSITTGNTFYTDSNGREMLKRVKDYRPTWRLHNLEPVAGNYYPVNSRLILDNGPDFRAAILTDRSQGGTSLNPGQMELMVHRRLFYDDAFGVGEPLNETQFGEGLVARGKHYLLHSSFASPECDFGCLHRTLGEELLLPPLYAFEETSALAHTWTNTAVNKWGGLGMNLPSNVHLLTLEPWGDNLLLLRLEHMYEKGESDTHSSPVTVSLKGLLADWAITGVEEMILSANLRKKDEHRLKWKVKTTSTAQASPSEQHRTNNIVHHQDPLSVTLGPMEIRTFVLTVKKASSRF